MRGGLFCAMILTLWCGSRSPLERGQGYEEESGCIPPAPLKRGGCGCGSLLRWLTMYSSALLCGSRSPLERG